jgi:hypothetical protein
MAANLQISINRGETFKRKFTYKDANATPFNLTGWSGVGQIRITTDDIKFYNLTVSFNADRTDGVFYVGLSYEDTYKIPQISHDPVTPDFYIYDVFLIHTDLTREKILFGKALIYPSITKGV